MPSSMRGPMCGSNAARRPEKNCGRLGDLRLRHRANPLSLRSPPRGGRRFFGAGRPSPSAFVALRRERLQRGAFGPPRAAPRKRGHPGKQPRVQAVAEAPSFTLESRPLLHPLLCNGRSLAGTSFKGVPFRGARACFKNTKQVLGPGRCPQNESFALGRKLSTAHYASTVAGAPSRHNVSCRFHFGTPTHSPWTGLPIVTMKPSRLIAALGRSPNRCAHKYSPRRGLIESLRSRHAGLDGPAWRLHIVAQRIYDFYESFK